MTDAPTTLDQDDAPTSEEATLSAIYSLLALTMRYPDGAWTNDQLLDTLDSPRNASAPMSAGARGITPPVSGT